MKATFVLALALAAGTVHAQDATAPVAATATAAGAPATPAAGEAAATPAPDAAKPKKICTRERSMGSNMTKRVCRDADTVENVGDMTRDTMRRTQQIGINNPQQSDL